MSDPYTGEIRVFAGNFAPLGWALCWGQQLSIAENDQLFTVIGTTYGGDGETNFALPDLRGRFPVHRPAGGAPGTTGGVETVTLTVNQLPVHNHQLVATTDLASQPTPGNVAPAQSGVVQLYTEDVTSVNMAPQAIQPVGGSQPHENMHPYLCLNFIICLTGTFPSQT